MKRKIRCTLDKRYNQLLKDRCRDDDDLNSLKAEAVSTLEGSDSNEVEHPDVYGRVGGGGESARNGSEMKRNERERGAL